MLILIVLTFILNILLSNRSSSDVVLMRNDSLVREFDEFRRTLTVRDPLSNAPEERNRFVERGSDSEHRSSAKTGSRYENNSRKGERYTSRSSDRSSYIAYPSVEKLSEGETISLNETDTAEWKKIPGIGSTYASRIVSYRNLLGGFVSAEQLLEVYGIDQELFSRIVVYIEPGGNFRRLHVNQSDFRELLRHPYLNYKQVQAIMSIRRRKGDITSIRELSFLDEFTPEDILRLEPYLEF